MSPKDLFEINEDPLNLYENEAEKVHAQEKEEASFLVDFDNTFIKNPSGQNIFKWLVAQCGVYDRPDANNFGEASQFLGRREIGLVLIEYMEKARNIDDIMEFFREAKGDERDEEPFG